MNIIFEILNKYYGYTSFKEGQYEIIIPKGSSIIKEGDVLVAVGNCLDEDFYKVIKAK